jgi:hypothetical protein
MPTEYDSQAKIKQESNILGPHCGIQYKIIQPETSATFIRNEIRPNCKEDTRLQISAYRRQEAVLPERRKGLFLNAVVKVRLAFIRERLL